MAAIWNSVDLRVGDKLIKEKGDAGSDNRERSWELVGALVFWPKAQMTPRQIGTWGVDEREVREGSFGSFLSLQRR